MTAMHRARARRIVAALGCAVVAGAVAPGAAHAAGLTPAQIHRAYDLPKHSRTTQTIAIVVPYHTPTAEKDLGTFSRRFGLRSCTSANGCFRRVNQRGQSAAPATDPTKGQWVTESALGIQTARGVCQNCKILLVEADSDSRGALIESVDTAVRLGADAVVVTWLLADPGGGRKALNHPGVAIVTASGDQGYFEGGFYPSSLPGVVAVGGTRLYRDGRGYYRREEVWNNGPQEKTTSGCATFTAVPGYQKLEAKAMGCNNHKSIVDISAVAWPGAQIYTSTPVEGETGWGEVGGTSLATPIIAGVFALAGGVPKGVIAPARLYANFHARRGGLHDVTTGNNGTCKKPICEARKGYDGPTGIGTPRGLAAFRRR